MTGLAGPAGAYGIRPVIGTLTYEHYGVMLTRRVYDG
jgi:hypothetical protein